MKKIIAAFDGLKYSAGTRDYAIAIAKETGAHLVGIFLEDVTYTGYKIYELIEQDGINQAKLKRLSENDRKTRQSAVQDFEEKCRNADIEFSVHRDRDTAKYELIQESIFADLLVIDRKETLTHYTETLPTRFIRDILEDAQCPVLLVPAQYKPIKKLIFLYDGGPSSVHAIKMSSYLLPELKNLDKEVVSVKPVRSAQDLPDTKFIREFMKWHYPKAVFSVKKGLAEYEIITHLKKQDKNALVVLGAYRRGSVSRWFKGSMANALMEKTKLPLFIAHNK